MPWKECCTMSLRQEFIMFALNETSNIRQLCSRFGISAKTGYKWINRYLQEGSEKSLQDRSRRPRKSPTRTANAIEEAVLGIRKEHPAWGGRKIKARLLMLGYNYVPAASTVTNILKRHNLIDPEEAKKHSPWKRFERDNPNSLWQMDFKGHFPTEKGRCHPLTILDDHSRFSLGIKACGNEKTETTTEKLTDVFQNYGLPDCMLMDNGSPWRDGDHFTKFSIWLIRLGIDVIHGRPVHPQTQGKDERFHKSLNIEVIKNRHFRDLDHCQYHFDKWRNIYNTERPHEALDMKTPAQRYQMSKRSFPEKLEAIEYGPNDIIRKVQDKGNISYHGKPFFIGKAFYGYPVALRNTAEDGILDVYFSHKKVAQINLND